MTTNALATLGRKLAERFSLEANDELLQTLKQTAFKSKEPASDAQLTALLVVAQQYGLNPFTKEIYAYPDQYKGIVPVVGVDGWSRIVNEHPQFDGMEFDFDPAFVTCRLYRKDRTRPTEVTEFLEECKRGTDPWKQMPKRMLRHKAFIQCARMAFGFALSDDEEGAQAAGMTIDASTGEIIDPPAPRGPQRKSAAAPQAPVDVDTTKATRGPSTEASARPTPAETPAPAPVAASASATTQSAQGGISGGQVAYLRNKMKSAGVDESTICDRFQVTGIELLNVAQFDEMKSELLAMV